MTDTTHLLDFLGWTYLANERLTPAPVRAMSATLDRDDPLPKGGDALQPLRHWLYSLPHEQQSKIGLDGHAQRGGFLPPVPLPRRMWACGRLAFPRPPRLGAAVTRTSRIADIARRSGRSGEMVFVQVRHEIADAEGVVLTEGHHIVYRELPAVDASPPKPRPPRTDEQFLRTIHPDPVLLFRCSARTFNGHRIHYDRSYVTGVEGYPGLRAQPADRDVAGRPAAPPTAAGTHRRLRLRGREPAVRHRPFEVCGRLGDPRTASLWARGPQGQLAMQATANLD